MWIVNDGVYITRLSGFRSHFRWDEVRELAIDDPPGLMETRRSPREGRKTLYFRLWYPASLLNYYGKSIELRDADFIQRIECAIEEFNPKRKRSSNRVRQQDRINTFEATSAGEVFGPAMTRTGSGDEDD